MTSPVRAAASRLAGSVTAVEGLSQRVVLTYDDGPEPGSTEQVLEALSEAGASATFFILVNRARKWPTLLREVRDAGHEIALHGPDHVRITTLPVHEVARRTRDAKGELEDMSQTQVRWFRPPYGEQRVADCLVTRSLGMDVVMWGPTLLDWQVATTAERLSAATDGLSPGAVLLAHDGFASTADGVDDGPNPMVDRKALTAGVLDDYRRRGLTGVSLAEALNEGRGVQRTWWMRR
jgi:peptidoglycan/xylan/chitin deacetylase (PgdA/CDA1 family)